MFKCAKCTEELRDGAQCSTCKLCFDFVCAGITESNFRKRKTPWKCRSCLDGHGTALSPAGSTAQVSLEGIMVELKRMSLALAAISSLKDDIQIIKSDVNDLKSSVEIAHSAIQAFATNVSEIENKITSIEAKCAELERLNQKVTKLEGLQNEKEQWARANNVEIKGIPYSRNENLIDLIQKIGDAVKFKLCKNQINFVTRIPTRNDNNIKPIIVCFLNKHVKEDFVAASRKSKNLSGSDICLPCGRIFINDHLTVTNKMLLTKVKAYVKERGYLYCWVKNCKILVRKNDTSPIHMIGSEEALYKLKN